MARKTLNQVLAENLAALLKARGLSHNALGKKAGISPRTVANYVAPNQSFTATGKEQSAKLAEIERIADALDVSPIALLTDAEDLARQHQVIAAAVAQSMGLPPAIEHPAGSSRKLPLRAA